jgi:hypothetical protein
VCLTPWQIRIGPSSAVSCHGLGRATPFSLTSNGKRKETKAYLKEEGADAKYLLTLAL